MQSNPDVVADNAASPTTPYSGTFDRPKVILGFDP